MLILLILFWLWPPFVYLSSGAWGLAPFNLAPDEPLISENRRFLTDENLNINSEAKNSTTEYESLNLKMNDAVNFMKRFGYIPAGDDNTDFIFSADSLKDRIKIVQKFGAIEQTGELDEPTLKLMSSPRCGVPDLGSPGSETPKRRKRFIVGSGGWNKRNITYSIGNWSPKLGSKDVVQKELRRAFDHWSRYSHLTFTEVNAGHGGHSDIVIFFAQYAHSDRYPFDGKGGVLAHAFYPYEFEHYGGDIHFDESENWLYKPDKNADGLDFFTVAVHEIGHSLGLAHSPVHESIMFPYYKGVEKNFALDYDDVMGMYQLYIQRRLEGDEEYFRTKSSSTTTTTEDPTTTSDDNNGVSYHGDSETVEEHEDRIKGAAATRRTPTLPPLFPATKDTVGSRREKDKKRKRHEEEEIRRRTQEEERRRRQQEEEEIRRRTQEEEWRRRQQEEEEIRKRTEEREEHEKNRKTSSQNPDSEDLVPDICSGNFDSAALIRGEIFLFKGKYMWRYGKKGLLTRGYPAPISSQFAALVNIDKIDAVYERRNDSSIVFFVGNNFYIHDGHQLIEGTPKSISKYGIDPKFASRVDAAFFWPKNGKTYIFAGGLYWRRDDFTGEVERGYPRSMDNWNGIPENIDAVITDRNGVTTFFRGSSQWRYDNSEVRPTRDSPRTGLNDWTGC